MVCLFEVKEPEVLKEPENMTTMKPEEETPEKMPEKKPKECLRNSGSRFPAFDEMITTTCHRGAEPRPQFRQGSGAETRGEPYDYHTTAQRITPEKAEVRKRERERERVSMRECGPMQRGRPCAAESDVRRCHVHLHRGAISKVRWAVVPGHSWGSGLNEKSPHVCSPSGATCRRASGVGWSASACQDS